MSNFKVLLLRFGNVIVSADSAKEADEKVKKLTDKDICWLNEYGGQIMPYLVTSIEPID